jgi:hypothetical protein
MDFLNNFFNKDEGYEKVSGLQIRFAMSQILTDFSLGEISVDELDKLTNKFNDYTKSLTQIDFNDNFDGDDMNAFIPLKIDDKLNCKFISENDIINI